LFKGTPLNEEQTIEMGLDLDLNFLDSFVDQQKAKGFSEYDSSKSMIAGSIALPTSHLNFKAYE
jgi:hypothetical protein